MNVGLVPDAIAAGDVDGDGIDEILSANGLSFSICEVGGDCEDWDWTQPVELRDVAMGDVDGETTSPTQPFPTHPPPLHPHTLSGDDVFGFTPFDRGACRDHNTALLLVTHDDAVLADFENVVDLADINRASAAQEL